MLKDNIKTMIVNDIQKCKDGLQLIKGSYDLYLELCAKYTKLDKTFMDSIQGMGKIMTQEGWDYRRELKQIIQILEVYLELDEIPIQYIENVASGVSIEISAKNFKNKGNLGVGNSQSTDRMTNVETNVAQKQSGFNSLFKKRRNK